MSVLIGGDWLPVTKANVNDQMVTVTISDSVAARSQNIHGLEISVATERFRDLSNFESSTHLSRSSKQPESLNKVNKNK